MVEGTKVYVPIVLIYSKIEQFTSLFRKEETHEQAGMRIILIGNPHYDFFFFQRDKRILVYFFKHLQECIIRHSLDVAQLKDFFLTKAGRLTWLCVLISLFPSYFLLLSVACSINTCVVLHSLSLSVSLPPLTPVCSLLLWF